MSTTAMNDYVRTYFRTWRDFVAQIGGTAEVISDLIEAKAAPGPIYSLEPDGSWWSALAASKGDAPRTPRPEGMHWYAKSAIWWLRRALLCVRAGASAEEAAASNIEHFSRQFLAAIAAEPLASERFPGTIGAAEAREEWHAWIRGG